MLVYDVMPRKRFMKSWMKLYSEKYLGNDVENPTALIETIPEENMIEDDNLKIFEIYRIVTVFKKKMDR